MKVVQFDLHGYYPEHIYGGIVELIVEQAWEMGADTLILIHGHGRNRGVTPGFVNANTGYLGLQVRAALQEKDLRKWVKISTLYRGHNGSTSIRLKPNPSPTRTNFDVSQE